MKRLYLEEGLTLQAISEQYGVSRQRVGQILGPQRKNAHYGKRLRTQALLNVRRPAFERIMAGESTPAEEAEKIGITVGTLREFLDANGMHIPTQFETSPKHGTSYRYSHDGCRCPKCKRGMRERRARMKERGPRVHGTASAYRNYGCRCDECRAAGSVDNRASREKRLRRQEEADVRTDHSH